ncbi:hypothetical protein SUGI_0812560, partial [Cryptomeria japonica]
ICSERWININDFKENGRRIRNLKDSARGWEANSTSESSHCGTSLEDGVNGCAAAEKKRQEISLGKIPSEISLGKEVCFTLASHLLKEVFSSSFQEQRRNDRKFH